MIRKILLVWLISALGFGLVATAFSRLASGPAAPPPAPLRTATPPADAQPVTQGRTLAQLATSPDTPLGDATFRIWCTWTLRKRLADRPDWTLHRAAAFCLCMIDRARGRQMADVPYVARSDFLASIDDTEGRLCREAP